VKADRHHTLCFQCYRALRDRLRLNGVDGHEERLSRSQRCA
jgi:hypothetical protein